jgi:hypothetical protein
MPQYAPCESALCEVHPALRGENSIAMGVIQAAIVHPAAETTKLGSTTCPAGC